MFFSALKKSFIRLSFLALCVGICVFILAFDRQKDDLQHVHDNAFRDVVVFEDLEAKRLALRLVYPYGEMDNPYVEGLSHYVEHLAWISALKQDSKPLERHTNAWTNSYTTGYWLSVDPDDMAAALQKLVNTAAPIEIARSFLQDERKIVAREYDLRFEGRPLYGPLVERNKHLYGSSPLTRSVIGTSEDIARYSELDARDLHARSHQLSAATLVVKGPVSARDVKKALKQVIMPNARTELLEEVDFGFPKEPLFDKKELFVDGLAAPELHYTKVVPLPGCGSLARCSLLLEIFDDIVDTPAKGGLARPLRLEGFVARRFKFDSYIEGNHAVLQFWAEPDRNKSLDDVLETFEATLAASLENGLPEEIVLKAIQDEQEAVRDDLGSVEADYDLFVGLNFVGAVPYGLKELDAEASELTPADLRAFTDAIAGPGRVAIRFFYPTPSSNDP